MLLDLSPPLNIVKSEGDKFSVAPFTFFRTSVMYTLTLNILLYVLSKWWWQGGGKAERADKSVFA